MSRQVVEHLLVRFTTGLTRHGTAAEVGVVGQAQHRAFVVEYESFVRGEDRGRFQARIGDTAGIHELQATIDLARESLIASTGRRGADELPIPVMNPTQVGFGTGQRAHQVHRCRGIGVGADEPRRIVDPSRLDRRESVDHVAAIRLEAECVDVGRARLGVLPRDPGHLDHGQARAVGQHDGHLQQGADVALDVRLGVVGECLGAITALEQEGAALGDVGEL